MHALLQKHRLDALVAPTDAPACPHLTVPMGLVGELPVGLSFVGAAWSDAQVLALGHAFEQATHARKPPRYFARSPVSLSPAGERVGERVSVSVAALSAAT